MSFWGGFARGMESGIARRERADERAYTRAWQDKMFEYRKAQDDYTRNRQEELDIIAAEDRKRRIESEDRATKLAEESLRLERIQTFLPYMNNPALASALGGSGSTEGLTPMSPQTIASGSDAFKLEFKELPSDSQKDPFFKALSNSPDGQAAVIAFMSAQAEKGNTIPLQDMPKYFKYLGATKGQNIEEAQTFLKSITEGESDINDTDTFIKGLMTFSSYKPVKHIFTQIDAPLSDQEIKTQEENWATAVQSQASMAAYKIPEDSEERASILGALAMMEQKETRNKGLSELARMGFGRDLLETQGFKDNFLISSFYETGTHSQDKRKFDTWDDVQKARKTEGFTGVATVGGVDYRIAGIGGPAPTISSIAPDAPSPKEDEFISFEREDSKGPSRRGGKAKFEKTRIDAMFGDSLDTQEFDMPPPRPRPDKPFVDTRSADEIIEDNTRDIQKAVKKGGTDEELAAIIKKNLLESGIQWPTNKQELGWFRDDIKEAVREYGMDVPDSALQIVIDEAIANVTPSKTVEQSDNKESGVFGNEFTSLFSSEPSDYIEYPPTDSPQKPVVDKELEEKVVNIIQRNDQEQLKAVLAEHGFEVIMQIIDKYDAMPIK